MKTDKDVIITRSRKEVVILPFTFVSGRFFGFFAEKCFDFELRVEFFTFFSVCFS